MQVETRRSQPSMPEASEPGDADPPPLVALMIEAAMATERLNAEAPRGSASPSLAQSSHLDMESL